MPEVVETDDTEESWPYTDPKTLNYELVDEPIRELCKRINTSKWLRTAESCAGHPRSAYAWSTSPYLRIILYKPKLNSYKMLWDIVEGFNEGWYSGLLKVQYGTKYDFGVGFYVTFPEPHKMWHRNIMIDLFYRCFENVESLYQFALDDWDKHEVEV